MVEQLLREDRSGEERGADANADGTETDRDDVRTLDEIIDTYAED
jgi:hypothetical protein